MATDIEVGQLDETIRDIVRTNGRLLARGDIRDKDDLFRAGMTSHATVNVMLALEDTFGVEFPERMLRRTTFASVASIREAVQELLLEG
jgi:acyl carrier protein